MQTAGLRSAVPPNQAATKPDLVSAMVEAWQEGKGAVSKMNSDFTMALSAFAVAQFAAKSESNDARQRIFDLVKFEVFIRLQNDICRCPPQKWRGRFQRAETSRLLPSHYSDLPPERKRWRWYS